MAENHLRQELRRAIDQSEPPWNAAAEPLRLTARRIRRRRRIVTGALAGCLSVVGVVTATAAIPHLIDSGRESTQTAASMDFSPDTLTASIQDAASVSASPPRWQQSVVQAYDAQGNLIEGADRDKATNWKATFTSSPDHILEIRLSHDEASTDTLLAACANDIEAGIDITCDVTDGSSGATIQTVVRRVASDNGAWAIVADRAGNMSSDQLWFQRMARAYKTDGSVVVAAKMVKAGSLEQARRTWSLDASDLAQIIGHDGLWFPQPPKGQNGCGWIVPSEAAQHSCGSN